MSDGAGGYEPGEIKIDTTIHITVDEWVVFTNKLIALKFWELPTESREETGTDGSEWILEGFSTSKYHFTVRWMPSIERNPKYKECCEYLIKLSKLNIPNDEIY